MSVHERDTWFGAVQAGSAAAPAARLRQVTAQAVPEAPRSQGFDDPTETGIYAQLVGLAVRATGARSVLDVGCGSGIPTLEAAREGAIEVVGIDCDPGSVERARGQVRQAGLQGQVAIHCASWQEVRAGRLSLAPELVVSNPPYVPGGQGLCVDGGLYGTSVLYEIIDNMPPSAHGLALLFASFSDPLALLARVATRGFELTHLLAYSVNFGRYTSMPATLSHLRRLRAQGKAWFCDVPGADGGAPHAYLTLGVVGRRISTSEPRSDAGSEFIDALGRLLAVYQERGPQALAG